jgi:hypothetical protein
MIFALLLAVAILALYLVKIDVFFHFLPTLSWAFFMCIPYIYSTSYFPDKTDQFVGITIVLIFFIIGDLLSTKLQRNKRINYDFKFNDFSEKYLNLFTVFIIAIPIVHFIIVGNVPIYSLFFEHKPLSTLRESRYEFNRDAIPYWFAMCSNYLNYLIGPFVLIIFAAKRKYIRFIVVFLWLCMYTVASGAKLTLVFCVFTLVLMGMNTIWKEYRKLISLGLLVIFIFTAISGLLVGALAESKSTTCPLPPGANFSPANILRSCPDGKLISINPVVDTLGYRVFLTPVEVSNNWYRYFSQDSNEKRSFSNIIERRNDKKMSNIIAINYYTKFWPNRYPLITNANTSVDADAFSIGGIPFVFFIGLMILVLRLIISVNYLVGIPFVKILEGAGIASLTVLPFDASIQAILIPNGLWIIIFLSVFLNLRYLWINRVNS